MSKKHDKNNIKIVLKIFSKKYSISVVFFIKFNFEYRVCNYKIEVSCLYLVNFF